jgi:hypothetical protein
MNLSQTQIDIINTNTTDILEFLDDIKETISNGQYISIANKLKKIYDIVNCDYDSEDDESEEDNDYNEIDDTIGINNNQIDIEDDNIYTMDYLDRYMDKYNSLVEKLPEHLRNTKYNIYNNRDIFKIRNCYCSLGEVCEYENNNHIYCSNYINFLLEHPLMIILELYISNEPETDENVKLYLNEYNLYFGHKYNEDYYSFNSVGNQYCRIKAIKTIKVHLKVMDMIQSPHNNKISKAIIGFYSIYSVISNYCRKFLIDEKIFNFTCYNKLEQFCNDDDDTEFIKKAGEYINLPSNTLDKALNNYYNFIMENYNIMDVIGSFI